MYGTRMPEMMLTTWYVLRAKQTVWARRRIAEVSATMA